MAASEKSQEDMPHRIFTYGTLSDTDTSGAPWTKHLIQGSEGTDGKIFGWKLYQHNIWSKKNQIKNGSFIRYPFAIQTNNPNDYVIGRVLSWPENDKVTFDSKLKEFDKVNGYSTDKKENECLFQRKIEKHVIINDLSNEANSLNVVSNVKLNAEIKDKTGDSDEKTQELLDNNNNNNKEVSCVFYYRKYENIHNWTENIIDIPFGNWNYRDWYYYTNINKLNINLNNNYSNFMNDEIRDLSALLSNMEIARNDNNNGDSNNDALEVKKIKPKLKKKKFEEEDNSNKSKIEINSRKEALYLLNKLSQCDGNVASMKSKLNEFETNLSQLKQKVHTSKYLAISKDDINKWQEWDVNSFISWIMTLENGKYSKYCGLLEYNLVKEEVSMDVIDSIDKNDLKQWGISNFKDRCQLIKHFKALTTSTNNNNVDDETEGSAANDQNEGDVSTAK